MRMILIYALAKRDQISGSGRVSRWSGGAFFAYNIGIFSRGYAMTTIIYLYLFAFFFLVAFGALAVAFTNWITRKIPSAPRDQKDGSGRA